METRIRLVGGRSESSGRIELYHNGGWGTVCDDLFDEKDGAVACVMAGYLPWVYRFTSWVVYSKISFISYNAKLKDATLLSCWK